MRCMAHLTVMCVQPYPHGSCSCQVEQQARLACRDSCSLSPMQVAPDFSCRLLDETYAEPNATIARIQSVMVCLCPALEAALQT